MLDFGRYETPATLGEALALLRDGPEGARVVAGATDLLPWAREGRAGDVRLPMAVDISRVAELRGHEVRGGRVRVGAGVTMQEFIEDGRLAAHLPCMPQCAVWFADDQIRRQATLAGNIVNASPAADATPPMLAMDAEVEVARLESGRVRRRAAPLSAFVTGPGQVDLRPGEILAAVTCDSLAGYGGSFQKVGQRRSLVISTVCAAACVRLGADGRTIDDARLALGGIGPVPVRLDDVEDALRGRECAPAAAREAAALVSGRIASRTRREYRRSVAQDFVEAAVLEAARDCARGAGRGVAHA